MHITKSSKNAEASAEPNAGVVDWVMEYIQNNIKDISEDAWSDKVSELANQLEAAEAKIVELNQQLSSALVERDLLKRAYPKTFRWPEYKDGTYAELGDMLSDDDSLPYKLAAVQVNQNGDVSLYGVGDVASRVILTDDFRVNRAQLTSLSDIDTEISMMVDGDVKAACMDIMNKVRAVVDNLNCDEI